ncbi:Elongator subunit elp6 [Geranomyces variabilis]|uniref:Elongator subunit elp6 n=1 Tax=Geranomyces variabilis TaxID=109894 RepID=A0AAD5XU53_9FUNG|nr:Elongator subunit elp6 [Geranomyces variabilis]
MSFPLVDAALNWQSPASVQPTRGLSSPSPTHRRQPDAAAVKRQAAGASSERTVIVVSDQVGAEGGFVLNHFIHRHLRLEEQGWIVVLVGLAQTWEHYLAVGKKLGLNIALSQQKGRLVFLDALTHLATGTGPFAHNEGATSATTAASPLQGLLASITAAYQACSSSPAQKKLCLVVDDVSALQSCGLPTKDVLAFAAGCRELVYEENGCLVLLAHGDSVAAGVDDDDGSGVICRSLIHSATHVLHVAALESGLTQGVDGQITFARGPLLRDEEGFNPEVLHYQITDAQINFFKKGFSKGLL